MCAAIGHARFTPNSDRESRHLPKVMSALPPKADMCSALGHVCFGPEADIRRAPIAERPYYPQASELLARVSRSGPDLLDDLIKVPALGALKRRKLFVALKLLEPQLL